MTNLNEHFVTFAFYNRWANRRLYAACAELGDADYRARRASFFGSIHATLNHILVADRVWLERLGQGPSGVGALDQMLYDDRAALDAARQAEDTRIIAFVESLDQSALARTVHYRTMSEQIPGRELRSPVHWVLGHMFNHQTHHRGQAHDQLSQTKMPPPPLDLMFYLREVGQA